MPRHDQKGFRICARCLRCPSQEVDLIVFVDESARPSRFGGGHHSLAYRLRLYGTIAPQRADQGKLQPSCCPGPNGLRYTRLLALPQQQAGSEDVQRTKTERPQRLLHFSLGAQVKIHDALRLDDFIEISLASYNNE